MLHLGKKDQTEERGNPCLIHSAFHWIAIIINITILVSLMEGTTPRSAWVLHKSGGKPVQPQEHTDKTHEGTNPQMA